MTNLFGLKKFWRRTCKSQNRELYLFLPDHPLNPPDLPDSRFTRFQISLSIIAQ
jgi:hypothetical protein